MAKRRYNVRINITLPADIADLLDRGAETENVSRSGYLMRLLLESKGARAEARRREKRQEVNSAARPKDWRPIDAEQG
jgi:metal-responsive CopG/Arc/MetJ family transcriptional regulator